MYFFCCFQDIQWIYTQKAVNFSEFLEKIHQICWFFGNDFHLQMAPGVRKPLGVTQRKKKSSEIYKFWKNSGDFWKILNYFCCFQDIKWNYTQKAVNFQFFLIPGSDFRLPGVRFSNGITLRSAFFQNRINFLKIWWRVMISDDELWWVMMSDDEWWGVMMRDNELWWVMISDGK